MTKLHEDAKIICKCGNVLSSQATVEEIRIELCSACHPFSTGKQTLDRNPEPGPRTGSKRS